jgi:hypothetical protein
VFALLIAAMVVATVSGLGLVLAAVGVCAESGWRQRWGIWLPATFGTALAVGLFSFVVLLISGIR